MSPTGQHYGSGEYGSGGYGGLVTDGGEAPDPEQAPYGGEAQTIPGRIIAADFDIGGEGGSYHETTESAPWAVDYRSETPVDIKRTPEGEDEPYAIGRFAAEEWLEYTVSVEPGLYTLRARVGTNHDDRQLVVTLGNEDLAVVDVPNQGWGTYATVETEVEIGGDAGERVLQLYPTADGVDVSWLEFVAVEPEPEPDPEPEPEPEPSPRTTIRVTIDGETETVVVFGASATDIEVVDGTVADPTVMLGVLPDGEGSSVP